MTKNIFNIQRFYVKESSFEAPSMPNLFKEPGSYENKMELQVNNSRLTEEDLYEVVLNLNINTTIKNEDKTTEAFKVKVVQAGMFQIKGFPQEDLNKLLDVHCSEILYPYARHVVSQLVVMGNLPPIVLQPINFYNLYEQKRKKNQSEATLH